MAINLPSWHLVPSHCLSEPRIRARPKICWAHWIRGPDVKGVLAETHDKFHVGLSYIMPNLTHQKAQNRDSNPKVSEMKTFAFRLWIGKVGCPNSTLSPFVDPWSKPTDIFFSFSNHLSTLLLHFSNHLLGTYMGKSFQAREHPEHGNSMLTKLGCLLEWWISSN
jgi:hypothetical protein